jgi:hypothetical protein
MGILKLLDPNQSKKELIEEENYQIQEMANQQELQQDMYNIQQEEIAKKQMYKLLEELKTLIESNDNTDIVKDKKDNLKSQIIDLEGEAGQLIPLPILLGKIQTRTWGIFNPFNPNSCGFDIFIGKHVFKNNPVAFIIVHH